MDVLHQMLPVYVKQYWFVTPCPINVVQNVITDAKHLNQDTRASYRIQFVSFSLYYEYMCMLQSFPFKIHVFIPLLLQHSWNISSFQVNYPGKYCFQHEVRFRGTSNVTFLIYCLHVLASPLPSKTETLILLRTSFLFL